MDANRSRPDPCPERRIDAVVFDLDDTLYPERDYVRSGYRHVARLLHERHGGPPGADAWMWERFCAGRSGNMFDEACRHFGLALPPEAMAELVRAYREHRPTLTPDPELLGALDALRGRVKLGLLSDGYLPAQQYKLEALGLADRFDAVLFTESLGRDCWKPSPRGFQWLADRLGVPHGHCCYVADNVAKDFVAPNALGWLTIRWQRPGQVHAALATAPGGAPAARAATAGELLRVLGLAPDSQ